ncbi:receptor-type tyrosine-protein phosphatase beta-like [Ptychodera flava]|uniref:receptor-type tyrosine-protein phosphatase beta-like n=1 Tax=Ptychodera flava TaxID=63121 RepID=UPI003969EF0B
MAYSRQSRYAASYIHTNIMLSMLSFCRGFAAFREIQTENPTTPETESTSQIRDLTWLTAILVTIFCVLMVVALAMVTLYLWRWKRYKDQKLKDSDQASLTHSIDSTIPAGEKNEHEISSKRMKISDYEEYFMKNIFNDDYFGKEYEELSEVGRNQSSEDARLPNNKPKNRYRNILPYDRTRVKLSKTDEEDSDYINANWIPGYNSPREFIAAQGVLAVTRADFWRMIWEYDVKNIVMVTLCFEDDRLKCDHYWPYDSEPVYHGDILVSVEKENILPEWTIREMTVQKDMLVKEVQQFNFTAWPDHGVPDTSKSLLQFVRTVREHMPNDKSPTVVHCSAGVGRTGTFIALDRLIQHVRDNDYVDIYGIAYEMRMQRMNMIQTAAQYRFIHKCVYDLLHRDVEDEVDENNGVHENSVTHESEDHEETRTSLRI